jgi:MFS family permease
MPVPTPGRDGESPSLVLQELSTLSTPSDLSASAGLPDVGERRGLSQTFRALRHRNFRLFVIGQIVSLVGTWMQNVAQSWLVYRLTHSALLMGTAWFCVQIPVFALGPLGGLAADRHSRHRLVVLTQTLSMFQALVLAILTLTGKVQVWHILALAVVLGTINAFDMPARQSLIVEMTSKEDLLNAISLNSAIFNAARVVGPAIAGLLVAAVGEGLCFLLNGVSFLAVIGCLLAMRLKHVKRQVADSPWAHLVQGLRYVHGHRAVRTLLGMMAAITIAGMPAVVLMPFFADGIFHRGSRGLGILLGAMGIGAVAGTLVLAWRARVSALPRVIFWSATLLGVSFSVFALSNAFYLSLAIMPLIGYSVMRQMASANTLIQTLIPDEFRGRTMALYSMTVVGLGPFGSLAAGALAHSYGARLTVLAGGLLTLAAAGVFRFKLHVIAEMC